MTIETQHNSRINSFIVFGICLLFAVVVFSPTLSTPFVSDGYTLAIYPVPQSHSLLEFFSNSYQGSSYYRPLVNISLSGINRLFGDNPLFFHLWQILIHALSGFFLYLIIRKILSSSRWALIGTLLFIIHPKVMHTVNWIGDHADALCLLFYLLSMVGVLRFIDNRNTKNNRSRKIFWGFVIAISAYLALLSKESGVTLLLAGSFLAWGQSVRQNDDNKRALKNGFITLGLMGLALLAVLFQRLIFEIPFQPHLLEEGLLSRPFVYLTYLPAVPYFYRALGLLGYLFFFLPSVVYYGLLAWGVLKAGLRSKKLNLIKALSSVPAFAFIWLFATLIPNLVSVQVWYFYLMIPGFIVGAMWLAQRLSRWKKLPTYITLGVVSAVYLFATFNASLAWGQAAEVSESMFADIMQEGEKIKQSGGVVLSAAPFNLSGRNDGLFDLPIYSSGRTWGERLTYELEENIDYRIGAFFSLDSPYSSDFEYKRTPSDVCCTTQNNEFFEVLWDHMVAEGSSHSDKQVTIPLEAEYPVFVLKGDRYILLE
ncbi:glycosyltransferase family 39 protein [bacterium]|nr:glycosyltransferase family 39 protein [bacterium]